MDYRPALALKNRGKRPDRRTRAASLSRLSAAAEPLEQRLLLTSVVVNTKADVTHPPGSTVISLRDAVNIADASTTPTAITFNPTVFATAKTISLNGSELELSGKQPVTITGPASGVTVNGNNESADFAIAKGAASTISRVTVTGGGEGQGTPDSGGIVNNGSLTLNRVTVTGNESADGGGGITNAGTLVITDSIVSKNAAYELFDLGNGGGIDNVSGAVMTLTDVTISGNTAANSAGIENDGTATLSGSTVSGNESVGGGVGPGYSAAGNDGGIGNHGKMTVTDCTVADNNSGGTGGGIGDYGTLTLTDSTISGNTAGGGGIYQFAFPAIFPVAVGGGLCIDPAGSAVIQNSIIAGNQIGRGQGPDVAGAVHSSGHNLIGQTNGSTGWKSADLTGTTAHPLAALLSPLGAFGGLTQTLVPLTGSPAIDAGSNALVSAGLAVDQRGMPRIANHTVDIGAVELQPSKARLGVITRTGLTATEGFSSNLSLGSFTEMGAAGPYTEVVSWGDGSANSALPVASPGVLPHTAHTFAEAGTYHGIVVVLDATGHSSTQTAFTFKVADAPLSGSATGLSGVAAGMPFAWHVAAFKDANPGGMASDFHASINWGDGTSSPGVVASTTAGSLTGPFGVTGTHTYTRAGTYTFIVTVKDVGGATLTVSSTIGCVNAKSIVVNTTKDQTDAAGSATVSLRDAVALADKSTAPVTISFSPTVFATAKTITLTGKDLALTSPTSISIVGPSAGVTVSGNNLSEVFNVGHGVRADFSGLTITQATTGVDNLGVTFLTNSSVTNNSSAGVSNSGYIVLTGVTVSNNQANGDSGIANQEDGKATLIDCTVADNSDGVDNFPDATLTLLDSTIAANIDGLNNETGTVFLANSIIAGNSDIDTGGGPVTSLGFNLIGKADAVGGWMSTDITGTVAKPLNPKLGSLANNGGLTKTLLPESGSPAINHGSNALIPAGLATDQRGLQRIGGGVVDIGAVEV